MNIIGVCNLSIIPLRSEASHRSEMVSQLLFGERFEIVEEVVDWVYIRQIDVSYEGWVQQGQFIKLEKENLSNDPYFGVVDVGGAKVQINEGEAINLIAGTLVADSMLGDEFKLHISGDIRRATIADFQGKLPQLIEYYLNSPYLWGGRSHLGIDCSGLTQAIFRHFGIQLARDAYQQADQGDVVDFYPEIKSGDLAFFDDPQGRITHVGMMIDKEYILHASAKVRIDRMDSEGIFNKDVNRYTHKLRIIKRYF